MFKPPTLLKFARGIYLFLLSAPAVLSIAATHTEIPTLPTYIVQGFDPSSYGSDTSSTATRIEVPHEELPLLLNVVSEYLLDEQQAINPSDAFKNISSVEGKVATSGQTNQVSIRGFNSFTFIDGFRVGNSNNNGLGAVSFATEVANIERIEVLKGPAATLYGRGLPGGVINYITKKPQSTTRTELSTQFGSDSLVRSTVDTTGSFSESPALQYRLVGSWSDQASYRDEVEQSSVSVYPSVNFQISEQTSLRLGAEYQQVEYTPDQGLLFLIDGSAAPANTRSFFYGSPDDQIEAEQYGINAQFESTVNDDYTFRAFIGHRRAEQTGTATLGTYVDGNTLERVVESINETRDDWSIQLDHILTKTHSVGTQLELQHEYLLTANWQYGRTAPSSSQTPLDFFDITTGQSTGPSPFAGPPNDFLLKSTDIGIGFQDLIAVNDRLHILLGLRYDESKLDFDFAPYPFNGDISLDNWSYRAGVIYKLTDTLSVFANYGSAFQPSLRINELGDTLFDLQQSVQYEAGFKVVFYGGWLTLNSAIYHLTNQDVIIADSQGKPVRANQESIGAELDLSARLTDRTTLLFNYAAIETKYTNGAFKGNELYGTPDQSGGLWLNHNLIQAADQRLSLSLGLFYQDSSYATDANNVELPDSLQVDSGIQYETGNWRFRLNAYNLLNEEAYVASPNQDVGNPNAPIFALPIAPTHLRFSASYSF